MIKRQREIKSPAFLFFAIWSHLAHAWTGLKFMCKANIKHLEIDKEILITFTLQQHLAFLNDLIFLFVFHLGCYMHLIKVTWE